MSKPPWKRSARYVAANDNGGEKPPFHVEVLVPSMLPITSSEIEVWAALIDDLSALAANDNGDDGE